MAQERALVISTRQDGWAQVLAERKDACDHCGASHCCVSSGSGSEMVVKALNRAGAEAGDLVSITLSPGTLLKGAAVLYVIPVAGLISGVVTGAGLHQQLSISETAAAMLLGLAGLFLGFITTGLISRWMSARNRLSPVITRIIKPGVRAPESLMAIDPVCKMEVNPAEAPASFSYQGDNYYFCQLSCRESFMKNPEKYL